MEAKEREGFMMKGYSIRSKAFSMYNLKAIIPLLPFFIVHGMIGLMNHNDIIMDISSFDKG